MPAARKTVVSKNGLAVRLRRCRACNMMFCGRPQSQPAMRCRCGTAYYCDATCQRRDWKMHRAQCRFLGSWHDDDDMWYVLLLRSMYITRHTEESSSAMDPAQVGRWPRLAWHSEQGCTMLEKFHAVWEVLIGSLSLKCNCIWPQVCACCARRRADATVINTALCFLAECADEFDGMPVILFCQTRRIAFLHYRHCALAAVMTACRVKYICGRKRGFMAMHQRFRDTAVALRTSCYARMLRNWKFKQEGAEECLVERRGAYARESTGTVERALSAI